MYANKAKSISNRCNWISSLSPHRNKYSIRSHLHDKSVVDFIPKWNEYCVTNTFIKTKQCLDSAYTYIHYNMHKCYPGRPANNFSLFYFCTHFIRKTYKKSIIIFAMTNKEEMMLCHIDYDYDCARRHCSMHTSNESSS